MPFCPPFHEKAQPRLFQHVLLSGEGVPCPDPRGSQNIRRETRWSESLKQTFREPVLPFGP